MKLTTFVLKTFRRRLSFVILHDYNSNNTNNTKGFVLAVSMFCMVLVSRIERWMLVLTVSPLDVHIDSHPHSSHHTLHVLAHPVLGSQLAEGGHRSLTHWGHKTVSG